MLPGFDVCGEEIVSRMATRFRFEEGRSVVGKNASVWSVRRINTLTSNKS